MNIKKLLASLGVTLAIAGFALIPTAQARVPHYYTNTYGSRVHRPARRPYIPAGASAQCGDGTFTFSRTSRGTCSHHSGVSTWLP